MRPGVWLGQAALKAPHVAAPVSVLTGERCFSSHQGPEPFPAPCALPLAPWRIDPVNAEGGLSGGPQPHSVPAACCFFTWVVPVDQQSLFTDTPLMAARASYGT